MFEVTLLLFKQFIVVHFTSNCFQNRYLKSRRMIKVMNVYLNFPYLNITRETVGHI